jgi:Tol biopolymer transport system component
LFWQAADGTGAVEQLTEGPNLRLPVAMTPDGNRIIIREVGQQDDDLMLVPLQPPRRPQPLVQTMFGERNAEIAPDGRWLAYESNESGREEIYVRPFPDVSGGWQVSTGGGRMPLWSRNGQELFYGSPDGALMGACGWSPDRRGAAARRPESSRVSSLIRVLGGRSTSPSTAGASS